MSYSSSHRRSERGSAGVKFMILLCVIILAAHGGYQYVPVAYQAESLKSEMQTAVVQGLALPGKVNPVDNVKARIQKSMVENQVPTNAILDVKQAGAVISAHVAYSKEVNILPFGIYKYNYQFNHTATPTGFLTKQ